MFLGSTFNAVAKSLRVCTLSCGEGGGYFPPYYISLYYITMTSSCPVKHIPLWICLARRSDHHYHHLGPSVGRSPGPSLRVRPSERANSFEYSASCLRAAIMPSSSPPLPSPRLPSFLLNSGLPSRPADRSFVLVMHCSPLLSSSPRRSPLAAAALMSPIQKRANRERLR